MLPELGQIALIISLMFACVLTVVPMLGAQVGNVALMNLARSAAAGMLAFLAVAYALLTHAFIVNDFSVAYVAQNSNSLLPLKFRISAVWGAHEGSLLLWCLILAGWTFALALWTRKLPLDYMARVLAVMGLVSVGFIAFTAFTSNPFDRLLPAALDGRDLNPLLQDFGLIVHPPTLYMGYVGFSVAFAFAVASLLVRNPDPRWVRWSRPWTNAAWGFLTLGIALGSWWAYYELGWGGWWFWDPVENASFMPWLVGTALIHAQAVTEKRGSFRNWTLLLSIAAFSLSLLGAFLVRSGVLTSVHAFANDPSRGLFILVFMGVVTGIALLLFALNAPRGETGKPFAPISRESLILINSLMFASATVMVAVGTLFPLLADALNLGKYSVGPPYFGTMFILLMAPVVALVVLGPFTRWGNDRLSRFGSPLMSALAVTALVAVLAWVLSNGLPLMALLGIIGGTWVMAGSLLYLWRRIRGREGSRRLTPELIGMTVAHFGIGAFVVGVLMVENTAVQNDVAMRPGDTVQIHGYTLRFEGVRPLVGPNFTGDEGMVRVYRDGQEITKMLPQKRFYTATRQMMTEVALYPGFTRDLYIAMGEPLGDDGSWAIRVHHKPFIRWIWGGALLMMIGAFIAAADRRLRERAPQGLQPDGSRASSATTRAEALPA